MKGKIVMGVVIVGLVAILAVQHLRQVASRQQAGQLAPLQAENRRLSEHLAAANHPAAPDREQMRATVPKPVEASSEAVPAAVQSPAPVAPASDSMEKELPKNSWTNAGFATPQRTLQSRGWAVLNGDRDAFRQAVYITDEARKFAEDTFVQMAEASNDPNKAQYIQDILDNKLGVEEAILMPMMALDRNSTLTGYRILSQESLSPDEMILQVETDLASAPAQTETLDFQRFGNDWKMVYDKATIQKMMKQ